jgi:hypothetical protein
MNNELIEKLARAICKSGMESINFKGNLESQYFHFEDMYNLEAKAALKVIEDEGYVCIDELIERAEKQRDVLDCYDTIGAHNKFVDIRNWLKHIKTENEST